MLKLTLKRKVIIIITAGTVLAVAGAMLAVYWQSRNTIIGLSESDLQSLIVEQTEETGQIFSASEQLVQSLVEQPAVVDFLADQSGFSAAQVDEVLRGYELGQTYSRIRLLDLAGKVVAATDPGLIGQDLGFREYFRESVAGKPAVGFNIGMGDSQPDFYFFSSVKSKEGKILGVAVVRLKPDAIFNSFKTSVVSEQEHRKNLRLSLTNADGILIFSDKKDWIYGSLGPLDEATKKRIEENRDFPGIAIKPLQYGILLPFVRQYSAPQSMEFFDSTENRSEILSLARIGNTPFFLMGEIGSSDLFASAFRISGTLALLVFPLVVAAAVLSAVWISKLLRPVEKLKLVSEKIRGGDLKARARIVSGDEFQELGESFDSMADRIQGFYAELEKEVKEKTGELAKNLKLLELRNEDLEKTKTATLNLLEDLSEEKNRSQEAQAKDEAIIQSIGDGLVVTDKDGKIVLANKTFEKIIGMKEGEMAGRSLFEVFEVEDAAGIFLPVSKRPLAVALSSGKTVSTSTLETSYFFVRPDKTKFAVAITAAPIIRDGEIVGGVGVFRDITAEKEIDRAKTEFVSLASHQLRTPLTAIGWYAEVLLSKDLGKVSAKQKEYLEEIYRSNKRMIDLVAALLNVSRIEMGVLAVEPRPTDVKAAVKSSLEDVSAQIRKKNLTIKEAFDRKLPPIVVDPSFLRIVVQNLISNAVKYARPKGRITIEVSRKASKILIKVSDNGVGIPKYQQRRIFEKLFRADNARIIDPDGSGLGLYIAKWVTEKSGGRIWFKSQEGKGTTFFVIFPIKGVSKQAGTKKLE